MGNKYSILIDANAWNFLEASNIDFQSDRLSNYDFFISIEVKREMDALADKPEKKGLYDFYTKNIALFMPTKIFFGFNDPNLSDDEQRFGGFGVGGLASLEESEFFEKNRHMIKNSKRKIYYGNESDLLIASRGNCNTYILTEDTKKNGPLKEAKNTINVSRKQPLTTEEFSNLLQNNIDK